MTKAVPDFFARNATAVNGLLCVHGSWHANLGGWEDDRFNLDQGSISAHPDSFDLLEFERFVEPANYYPEVILVHGQQHSLDSPSVFVAHYDVHLRLPCVNSLQCCPANYKLALVNSRKSKLGLNPDGQFFQDLADKRLGIAEKH
jgi:RNA-metabolizing metallo-beta-lactamase